jgi:hypothetical protein
LAFLPELVWAAGGGEVSELVVVADTRKLTGLNHYFANLYNENIWLFAVWATFMTSALGAVLGLLMDVVMRTTGLDLTKGHKTEH